MNTKIQILSPISAGTAGLPTDSHILIDTSFLIDAYKYEKVFDEIIKPLRKSKRQLITIDAVLYEFVCGSKSIQEYNRRLNYFNAVIDATLPVDPFVISHCLGISRLLLSRGSHLSYVDGLLLASLVRYTHEKTYLLSKDRGDIPTTIFPIALTLNIETGQNNHAFSVYDFDKKYYTEGLKRLSQ